MGPKAGTKPADHQHRLVTQAPIVVYDGSVPSRLHSKRPSFQDWKLFMSPRASDVLAEPSARRVTEDNDEVAHTEEFKSILKEVEQLGTSTLSWKDRKRWESDKLVTLGAKPVKSFKMPVSMGLGMKRKREQVEEQKRQEDITSGLRSAKRTNSERRPTIKRNAEERGLHASEGKFKGGVLFVKPPSAAPKERFSRRAGGDVFLNSEDSKSKAGSAKSKKKGKGKKQKGGKKKKR